ncbi:MAG: hypothetical protein AAGF11_01900 [Myxococcota bacterium]
MSDDEARQASPKQPSMMTTAPVPDEDEFVEGASNAIEAAIKRLHERGIATTHLIDGRLVKIHPDGRREDLGAPSH